MTKFKTIAGAALLVGAILLAESINPPTSSQTAPMGAKEKKNVDMVLTWWREVITGRHTELAEKYQAVDYIQHNPNISTGRAEFVKFFGSLGAAVNPIPTKLATEPVVRGAKGDFVWLIWEREDKDPRDASKTYHYNTFDVLRIQNGKVQEHWDDAKKNPPRPGTPVVAVNYGSKAIPPMKWNTGKLSKDEQHNLDLATEELKDMLQYGHLELADKTMDPGYIQHNPNVPQGRDGFKQFMSRVPGRVPETIKPEWKSAPALTLVEGPYVVFMWDRTDKDPADPSKNYVWNHFDVVRIEAGKIKEHWDEARINAPAPAGNKK